MHSYEVLTSAERIPDLPSLDSFPFNDARDVVARARVDPCIGWMTWPEVWHLDEAGRFCCGYKGSSMDSIQGWADDPSPLRRSRLEGLRDGGCADHWVVVDSRPGWYRPPPSVNESDVEAFVEMRGALAPVGVSLLDVVIFDNRRHWWSLHELTSGSTRWHLEARG